MRPNTILIDAGIAGHVLSQATATVNQPIVDGGAAH